VCTFYSSSIFVFVRFLTTFSCTFITFARCSMMNILLSCQKETQRKILQNTNKHKRKEKKWKEKKRENCVQIFWYVGPQNKSGRHIKSITKCDKM